MRKTKNILLTTWWMIVLIVCLQNTLLAQLSDKNYKIYCVKTGKEVTLKDIAVDMKNYDVLFFGEEHNDSVTHFLEKSMLEQLFEVYGSNITLSMEMFDRDAQEVMNEYLQGDIKEKFLIKDARCWSNYKDYRPMIEMAKTNHLAVVCANAPTRYTNLAGRKGQGALNSLPQEAKAWIAPLPYDTASGKYYEKLMNLTSHDASPTLPTSDTTLKPTTPVVSMGGFNLILAQSLWDATMAYSIADYLRHAKDKKVMQVNGRFHSDERFAVVAQLKKYNPKLKTLVISATTDDAFPTIDWHQYEQIADYIIITDPHIPKTYED